MRAIEERIVTPDPELLIAEARARQRARRRRQVAGLGITAAVIAGVVLLLSGGGKHSTVDHPPHPPVAISVPGTAGALTELGAPAQALAVADGRVFAAGVGWYGTYGGSGLTVSQAGDVARTPGIIDGQISDATPDGRGGAYVGGDFQHVGSVRQPFLARLLPSGALDRAFRPRAGAFVDAVLVHDGRVYAGGDDGVSIYDARTGATLRHFALGRVTELLVSGSTLYAGGANPLHVYPTPPSSGGSASDAPTGAGQTVTAVTAAPTRYRSVPLSLSATDLRTGRPLAGFNAPIVPGTVTGVSALALIHGRLWVGVRSTASGRTPGLMALDPQTGSGANLRGVSGEVDAILPLSARRVLLTGDVNPIVGSLLRQTGTPRGAVIVDPVSDAVDSHFACGLRSAAGPASAYAAALIDGRLWLGGGQTGGEAGQSTGVLAAVDPSTCATQRVITPDSAVDTVVPLGRGVLAGGRFTAGRPHVATDLVFSARTGRPLGPAHGLLESTEAMLATPGGLWVASVSTLRKINPRTGRVLLSIHLAQGNVAYDENPVTGAGTVTLAMAGGRIFVLTNGYGAVAPVGVLRAYDASTGQPARYRIPLPASGPDRSSVAAITAINGSLYLAGSFLRRRSDGQPANIAVIKTDPRTGALDPAFDPHVNGPVRSLASNGRLLVLDGDFTEPRTALVAVDPHTGALAPDAVTGRVASGTALTDTAISSLGELLGVQSTDSGEMALRSPSSGRPLGVGIDGLPELDQVLPDGAGHWFVTGRRPVAAVLEPTPNLEFAGLATPPS